ncbi:MAG TPA: M48 family metallopeptidase [Deltaproteobacteria bacterium]|mgnify:CR=1 FL=1|jgi:predicted Zn-dependent protease|nr:M48 family metallopeptidase [Deltaproteobacteria bacterium]HOI06596.1 M48 family metallopeptidase [Deltaproteobacteria bacterium]
MDLTFESSVRKGAYPVAAWALSLFLFLAAFSGCTTVPITGRSQLLLVPEDQEIELGNQAYQQVLAKDQAKVSKDPQLNTMVNTIGRRIAAVADKPDYNWQFTVIDDDKTVNAFALPGGKVAIYTGILPYTKDEAGLAFVMAHEIAHALARHGGERMSQQLLVQLGQQGLNLAIANKSPAAVQAINTGYGLASQVGVVLPFSRTQEYEADRLGLILMAKAGYDPRQAPAFFERMMNQADKQSPPEFLSTHPADQARIQNLKELMPEALSYYRK